MSQATLIFKPNDSLFFRESRPMEAHGSKPLGGLFPPPATTVGGAVRAMIGEHLDVNWRDYRSNKSPELIYDAIGEPTDSPPGPLQLTGPFPVKNGERLYPAPSHLLFKESVEGSTKASSYRLLDTLTPLDCDLGKVELPAATVTLNGEKPLENAWLKKDDLEKVLSGKTPSTHITTEQQDGIHEWLLSSEPRLGIALDQSKRVAEESKLYQTVHARLADDVAVAVNVCLKDGNDYFDEIKATNPIVRLGGEGRFASVEVMSVESKKFLPKASANQGVLLMLLTPALVNTNADDQTVKNVIKSIFSTTADDTSSGDDEHMVWHAEFTLNEEMFTVKIRSAAMGKAIRLGGWNLKEHRSREVKSFVPAGSVFYCECDEAEKFVTAFNNHYKPAGEGHQLGYGEMVAGYWGKDSNE